MAAGLAHELRNPLAGMEVMAGLLRRRLADGSEEHALVLDILAQLRAVAHTLDEALEFVRPSAPSPDAVDPVPLVELALERALGRVPFAGKLERDYAPALPRVAVDPEQMLAVFTDLLVNALEAVRPGAEVREPRVCLTVRPGPSDRREVVVSIADNGPGVPEGLRERIFYPFFTTKPGGSGVGLAKAQKVVTSHGGALELASAGGGATFRVRLPAAGSGE
jgi:two-component system nitrogen regulation sensor histidine kinase GlnL